MKTIKIILIIAILSSCSQMKRTTKIAKTYLGHSIEEVIDVNDFPDVSYKLGNNFYWTYYFKNVSIAIISDSTNIVTGFKILKHK